MIPEGSLDLSLVVVDEEVITNTYYMTETDIQGFVDELGALQQAIYKELNTEKFQYEIYSFDYGIELDELIGLDASLVKAELKRRIVECLDKYDEIQAVDGFHFETNGDNLLCVFNVTSIYGEFNQEVNVNV